MSKEEYTNRELGILLEKGFEGVNQRLDISNGNVANHSKEIANLKLWRSYLTGAFAVITAIFVPTLIYVIKKFLE